VDSACRVHWAPYRSMYKNPKSGEVILSFFWFGNLGMWWEGMVFDQFFYGYGVWLVSAWACALGCGS
jgi:hypothetical protein